MNGKKSSMKKQIKDVTFEEFDNWANERCCDGGWSLVMAIASAEIIGKIFDETKHIILPRKKKKTREELFEKYKPEYFNLEGEIDV